MAQKLNIFSSRQFLDANGDPYVGAKLFVYFAGGNTKATVTKDSAGVSAHANPITLNSKGEPGDGAGAAQAIWQPEGVSLKLVLAPAGDTDPPVSAIDTWDNIAGINDTTVTIDQWVSAATPTYVSATSFTLVGDQTSDFHVGRRLKTTNTGGTIYSTITDTAYTTLTTVTVVNDSGTLDSGLSAASYGLLTSENPSVPGDLTKIRKLVMSGLLSEAEGANIASATDCDIWANEDGNTVHLTGTTTVTDWGTAPQAGAVMRVICDAATPLTYNATTCDLNTGGANYTTAAGDILIVYARTTSSYQVTVIPYSGKTLDPITTTRGDIIVRNATENERLAVGTVGQVLSSDGTDPSWGLVAQANLKTTTGEISTTSATTVKLALPGGEYGFYPQVKNNNTGAAAELTAIIGDPNGTSDSTSYITRLSLANESGSSTTTSKQRYIQASPPYDLGDGEIPMFIFAEIHKSTGKVVSVYSAPEAPWHYNGPTDIRGKLINGKKYRERKDMSLVNFTLAEARADIGKLQEYTDAFKSAPVIYEEITQEIKNADMSLIPRPMEPRADTVVVMLDPVSDLTWKLTEMANHDEFSINELLHDEIITIQNTPLKRCSPSNVGVMGFKWK